MKHIKIFLLFFMMQASSVILKAQDKDAASVKEMIESKSYIFKAQLVSPQNGRNVFLTSDYDVSVRGDTVISYLPYFGRAYTAPVNPAEGGIKFTSADFEYKADKSKKDGWEIMIKPHDVTDVQQLYLTVFDNGSASLQVISTNRQTISFNGYITEGKPINKKAF